MKSLTVPAFLLVPLLAAAVLFGGQVGAGAAALGAGFLAALAILLFRHHVTSMAAHTAWRPGQETRVTAGASNREFLAFLVLAALFVRAFAALGLRQSGLHAVIAPDELTFHTNARIFASWLAGDHGYMFGYRWEGSTQVGYFVFVGTLYWVLGVFPMVPVLLNCVAGSLCAIPAHRLASRIGGATAGRIAAVLVAFFPSLMLWSTLLIRDSWAMLLILWTAVLGQELIRRFTLRRMIALLLCMAALATLRSYLFLLVGGAVGVGWLIAGVRRPGRALGAAILGTGGVLAFVRGLGLGTDYLSLANFESIAQRRELNAIGEAGIELAGHDLSTPLGALTYLPMGLSWFLLSPFPWETGGKQVLAVPDVLMWYVLLPFVVYGAVWSLRRRRRSSTVPLLLATLISLLYALVSGNVGIIFRHRAQVLVLLLPFAAIAIARLLRARARRRREREPVWLRRGAAAA